jgi:hypothetical protein
MSAYDDTPVMRVQRTGERERGFMAWRAWVEVGLLRYQREYGTYAWSREGAERKARRLLRRYLASRPGPAIHVDEEGL